MAVRLRRYRAEDAPSLVRLFYDSVRIAGLRDYTPAQVEAWAPAVPDAAAFSARTADGRRTWVAIDDAGEALGYVDLEASGVIDHLYCRPEAVGTGVGSALVDAAEVEGRASGMLKLSVDASEAARRLFLAKGFAVTSRRDFVLRGVAIHHYRMEKTLQALAR